MCGIKVVYSLSITKQFNNDEAGQDGFKVQPLAAAVNVCSMRFGLVARWMAWNNVRDAAAIC